MLFTIVEDFGKSSGEVWESYIAWRGIQFDRFDSLDGILRSSLFDPETEEDWAYVVHESFMLSYITDIDYASKIHARIGAGSLMGLSYSDHDEGNEGFLGYDIIDGCCDVSLLTNWGNDLEIVNCSLGRNALIPTFGQVKPIHQFLVSQYEKDSHVEGCRIASVYSTGHLGVNFL